VRSQVTVLLLLLLAGCNATRRDADSARATGPQLPDSATAVSAALDTMARLGARDLIVDSLARHGDTLTVWFGPPNRMITDRPATGVAVLRPARVVSVRHVLGG
jgi:hypothetical protein